MYQQSHNRGVASQTHGDCLGSRVDRGAVPIHSLTVVNTTLWRALFRRGAAFVTTYRIRGGALRHTFAIVARLPWRTREIV